MGWWAWLREQVYPSGGFVRATRYVMHRMSRLPDDPARVARGVFAGCLVGFLPLPGLQFLAAWGAAKLVRGNVLAALLGTFNTNPVTTPFFAVFALAFGQWLMGIKAQFTAEAIGRAFADAGTDLWRNTKSLFNEDTAHWTGLVQFWTDIYVPYFIGALVSGTVLSAIAYYLTIPLVHAYQKRRAAKTEERAHRRVKFREALDRAAARLRLNRDDDTVKGAESGKE
jgi:uncharacterized protein (DUF2062 family)